MPCRELKRRLQSRTTQARTRQNRPWGRGRFLTRSRAQLGGPVAFFVESVFKCRSPACAQVPCLLFGGRFGAVQLMQADRVRDRTPVRYFTGSAAFAIGADADMAPVISRHPRGRPTTTSGFPTRREPHPRSRDSGTSS